MTIKNLGYFDTIKLRQNEDDFRQIFRKTAEGNKEKAIRYINKDDLRFPFLFVLIPEIETLELYQDLNPKNIIALKTCAQKLDNQNLAGRLDILAERETQPQPALRWMYETGIDWDGPNEINERNAYESVLDATAALLIDKYEDKAILPSVAQLIFKRHRQGLYIHDLVWSFFRNLDPSSLRLIAKYLLSAEENDIRLACKLLDLPLPQGSDLEKSKRKLYKEYLIWLSENAPFLYLTGECFQYTSDPQLIKVDLEAKYLHKEITPRSRQPLAPLTETEIRQLNLFKEIPQKERQILSRYSHKIHNRDQRSWLKWLNEPLPEQIRIAKSGSEVDI